MTIKINFDQGFCTEDLRAAFKEVIQKEIAARNPSEAVEQLYQDEPEQQRFSITFSKKDDL